MNISLKKASVSDCEVLYELQIKSFKDLLDKVEFIEISKNNNQNPELQIDSEHNQIDNHVNEE